MEPYYADGPVTLHLGDCLDVLPSLPDSSIDAVVTDPPYGLEFMGREWDGADGFRRSLNEADASRDSVFGRTSRTSPEYRTGKPSAARIRPPSEADQSSGRAHNATTSLVARNAPEAYVAGPLFQRWCETWARECLRVLKPGGYLLAFGGTRTYHRLACAIEDAGFEIRDSLHWIYGSGFPKSLDVSKAIDKAAGATREVVGTRPQFPDGTRGARARPNASPEIYGDRTGLPGEIPVTAPATENAARWSGFGTALKPAHEPIVCARKPLAGTVAANVLEWGTGALNIDGCRVEGAAGNGHWIRNGEMGTRGIYGQGGQAGADYGGQNPAGGRWPPNILLTHSPDCQPTGLRGSGGLSTSGHAGQGGLTERKSGTEIVEAWDCTPDCPVAEMDAQSGIGKSPAPYTRTSAADSGIYGAGATARQAGDQTGDYGDTGGASRFFPCFRYQAKAPASERPKLPDGTAWPTVKPLELMRWLVRLVSPPGGVVLDPFAGTGTTGQAAALEGFRCILIERDPVAAELALQRFRKPVQQQMTLCEMT